MLFGNETSLIGRVPLPLAVGVSLPLSPLTVVVPLPSQYNRSANDCQVLSLSIMFYNNLLTHPFLLKWFKFNQRNINLAIFKIRNNNKNLIL